MIIDLRKGFGDFEEYKLFKFPDNSIKFEIKRLTEKNSEDIIIKTSLKSSDDILTLALVKNVLDNFKTFIKYQGKLSLQINYLMYQQDDRNFKVTESFGLKVISNFINGMNWDIIQIFHPHSDKVEFINNIGIVDNTKFLTSCLVDLTGKVKEDNPYWVIPDSGAFKTQFKQIEKLNYNNFITCMKSRDFNTGEITTVVNTEDLQGKDCFIVDDICLGGQTFINIAKELQKKNCGKLYLIISHGVFNKGIDHLYEYFDCIYTTDSICTLEETDKLKIFKL